MNTDKIILYLFIIVLIIFSGCIMLDSVNYNMKITYENNWDKPVDIVVEWNAGGGGGYELKSLLIGQKVSGANESGSLSSSNDKMNFTIYLYDLNSPTDDDGYKIKDYALKLKNYIINLDSKDNNIYFNVIINMKGDIVIEEFD